MEIPEEDSKGVLVNRLSDPYLIKEAIQQGKVLWKLKENQSSNIRPQEVNTMDMNNIKTVEERIISKGGTIKWIS